MVRLTIRHMRAVNFHPSACAEMETIDAEQYVRAYRRKFGSDAWIDARIAKYDAIAKQNAELDAAGIA